ncbi:UNVERIFIED_CONTAM: hypothetical protein Slati_1437800 [Sesamum latifolium]|uniref:Uncharacterized protein n=1 Tax=Sesamum latifolium TaxID=2727402 RepID=A0AAW2X6E4_9LAMI
MDTNKFNSTNYNDWLRNLRIVLDFENQGYVFDKPLPTALPEGSSPEEHLTFDKWLEDNCKVRSIILASMTNEIQKQYDRLEDVASIMLSLRLFLGMVRLEPFHKLFATDSSIWKRIYTIRTDAQANIFWSLGDGTISFWHDWWLPKGILANLVGTQFNFHIPVNWFWLNHE